jgi:hypothetical protein
MRKEGLAALIAILVVASLGAGYLAGRGARSTETATSTSTSIMASTTTLLQTTVSSVVVENNLTTTVTSTAEPTGEPIPVAGVETSNVSIRGTAYIVGVDPGLGSIYVTGAPSYVADKPSSLLVLDASSGSVQANLTLPVDINGGIAVDYTTNTLYIPLATYNTTLATFVPYGIAVINGSTNEIVRVLPIDLSSLAYDPSTQILYGASGKSLAGVDVQTGSTAANISLGYEPGAVTVDPKTDMVYVAGCPAAGNACNEMASIVNGTSETLVATVSIYSDSGGGMAFDPATNILYVAGAGQLRALNGTNGNVVFVARPQTCELGSIVDIPSSDQVVAIPGLFAGMYNYLAVYDGTTGALVNMYSFPSPPQSVAYNPNTNELYVTLPGELISFHDFPITGNVNSTLIGGGEDCGNP